MSGERFFDWLAGFIDGEGCFTIPDRQGHHAPRFTLVVRDDDQPILEEIVARTGIGRLYRIAASGTSNPQAAWHVESKQGVAQLVRILDAHPLRARKARDYAIWREAVSEWHTFNRPKRLAVLRARLVEGRRYDAQPIELPVQVADEPLLLFDVEREAA